MNNGIPFEEIPIEKLKELAEYWNPKKITKSSNPRKKRHLNTNHNLKTTSHETPNS